jgi:GEVED domain/Secretion system C-terminal sorting domain
VSTIPVASGVTGGSISYTIQSSGIFSSILYHTYVDWNSDGDFTDGGEFEDDDVIFGTGVSFPVITIPSGATLGIKRVRILGASGSITTNGCSTSDGQVRDYLISVLPSSPPACANLTFPANGSTLANVSPVLQWTPGSGTAPTGYDVYFGTTPNPPLVADSIIPESYNPGVLTPNTQYYWRIVPVAYNFVASGCPTWNFFTPVAPPPAGCVATPVPANGATISNVNQDLSWAPGAGPAPTTYDVYFGTNPNPPLFQAGLTVASFALPQLNGGTTYYWRIVPFNTFLPATGCATFSFTTTGSAVPPCPSLLFPANGDILTFNSTQFLWSSSLPTGNPQASYTFNFGPTPTPSFYNSGIIDTMYSVANLNLGQTYYWQALPTFWGTTNATCPVFSFQYPQIPTGTPCVPYSSMNPCLWDSILVIRVMSEVDTILDTIRCGQPVYKNQMFTHRLKVGRKSDILLQIIDENTAPSYFSYELYLDSAAQIIQLFYNQQVNPNELFSLFALQVDSTISVDLARFRVSVSQTLMGGTCSLGNEGFARDYTFEVEYDTAITTPLCMVPVYPPDGSTNIAQDPIFRASSPLASSIPEDFDLYFSQTPTLGAPAIVNAFGPNFFITGGMAPNTTYYWSIVPKNQAGTATGCPVWSFTTAPVCVPTSETVTRPILNLVQLIDTTGAMVLADTLPMQQVLGYGEQTANYKNLFDSITVIARAADTLRITTALPAADFATVALYADWNNDGTFAASELLYATTTAGGTLPVVLPQVALSGLFRMRLLIATPRNGVAVPTVLLPCTANFGMVYDVKLAYTGPPAALIQGYTVSCAPMLALGTADVDVQGGTPPFTYLWQPGGATTDSISGLQPGTYQVLVTDAENFTSTASVSVGVNTGSITGNIAGASTAVTLTPQPYTVSTNTTGAVTYLWSTTNGTILAGQGTATAQVQWTAPGNFTLRCTVTVSAFPMCNRVITRSVLVTQTSGLAHSPTHQLDVSLQPNPSTGTVTLVSAQMPDQVDVLNMQGQVVYTSTLIAGGTLQLTHLPNGVYIVRAIKTGYTASHIRLVLE